MTMSVFFRDLVPSRFKHASANRSNHTGNDNDCRRIVLDYEIEPPSNPGMAKSL